MDLHVNYVEPATPTLPFQSFSKTEDSGYHTFTPSSLESELSSDLLDTSRILKNNCYKGHIQSNRKPNRQKTQLEVLAETPPIKRGVKRLYQEDTEIYNTVPTPTTAIAGKIRSLDVNENKENASCFISPLSATCGDKYNRELPLNGYELAYPSTPVKNNCVVNPCRKTPKKLSFIHSLSCESSELLPVTKQKPSDAALVKYHRPELKVDILSRLQQVNCAVPLAKIFDFLSNEDIQNVALVCSTWRNIWGYQPKKKKFEYYQYLKNVKENQENRAKGIVCKVNIGKHTKLLNEIHNEIHNNLGNHVIPRSPPSTPRTNRFRKFAKAALLDSRIQIECARCQQPAKVSKEGSGEVWAECTSLTCSYQFCKNCKCDRHPETTCFQYDLEGPSPSKRRKNPYAVGTKKSRKNLRRLMDNAY